MKKIIIAILIAISLLGLSSCTLKNYYATSSKENDYQPVLVKTIAELEWFEGGTLHKKEIIDWKVADYRDRLATCADYSVAMGKSMDISFSDMDEIHSASVELEACISAAVDGMTALDHDPISETAGICWVLLHSE